MKFSNLDPVQFAHGVADVANEVSADPVFVDAAGLGERTVASLRQLGVAVQPVYFAGKADNSGLVRCANRRSEMWTKMSEWLKAGAIPNDPQLKAELIGPEYSENAMGLILERKADMKSRGLSSPDIADALALTFASPVFKFDNLPGAGDNSVTSEYDPLSDDALAGRPLPESRRKYIAPGWSSLKAGEWDGQDWRDAQASDALGWGE